MRGCYECIDAKPVDRSSLPTLGPTNASQKRESETILIEPKRTAFVGVGARSEAMTQVVVDSK